MLIKMHIQFICFSYIGYIKLNYCQAYLELQDYHLYVIVQKLPRSKQTMQLAQQGRLHEYVLLYTS